LSKHYRAHAFYFNCSYEGHTDAAILWYLYWRRGKTGDLKLNCSGEINRTRFGHRGQDNNGVRLFWVPGPCNIEGIEDADRLARMGSDSYICGPEPYVLLSASVVQDMNGRWVIDAHSKHWIPLNNCRQSKL
jgi:hypothetical protein